MCMSRVATGVFSPEGHVSGKQFVEDDAEGVEVCAQVDLVASSLLGAHVLRGAEHLPGHRSSGSGFAFELFGDSKVHESDDAFRVSHDVGGLQVAVDDRRRVNGLEAARGLDHCVEGLVWGKGSVAAEKLLQIHAVHVFHDDETEMAILPEFVYRAHVGMAHPAGEANL